jgi:hypothetical protein
LALLSGLRVEHSPWRTGSATGRSCSDSKSTVDVRRRRVAPAVSNDELDVRCKAAKDDGGRRGALVHTSASVAVTMKASLPSRS